MTRVLLVFEHDDRGRPPDAVAAVAAAVEQDDAELRLRTLEASGVRDVAWADAMALGIDGRGAALPAETKYWLDGLGFAGWRHLRDKPGCVFATRARGGEAAAACRMVARILRSRGMDAVTPGELRGPGTAAGDDGAGLGAAFMRWCRRPREAPARVAGATATAAAGDRPMPVVPVRGGSLIGDGKG